MPEIPFDVQFPTISSFFEQAEPWTVIDMDSASKPGEQFTVVGRFESEQEASEWIGQQDPAKVERGGFGIDGPDDEGLVEW